MRNIFITTVILFSLMSCSTHNKSNHNSDEENFVLSYKKSVLYGCVNEATNNNLSLFSKENNDLGLAIEVEIIQHQEVFNALNKGKELSKKIRAINYTDFEDKKPIFSDCINFAFSKEIDSIARDLYKRKEKY
jgi:hypothetical protein